MSGIGPRTLSDDRVGVEPPAGRRLLYRLWSCIVELHMAADDHDHSDPTRTWARAIAGVEGMGLALGIHVTLRILVHRYPRFAEKYTGAANHFSLLPKQLPWGFWGTCAVGLAIAAYLLRSRRAHKLAFVLFGAFDRITLEAVTRYTGMLRWHLPATGQVRETWNRLLAWSTGGLEFVRAPSRLPKVFQAPTVKVPFAWTILTGANASGKTQMAKELGRFLAQRAKLGDGTPASSGHHHKRWRLRLGQWYQRLRRIDAETMAWDAGCVAKQSHQKDEYRLQRLREWVPRAPTLLILDDPPSGVCSAVIASLAARERQFRFPVRLLIVDRFFPADLPITKYTDRTGWHHLDTAATRFEPMFLGVPQFDPGEVRSALANGFWVVTPDGAVTLATQSDIPALYRSRDLEQLVTATEGHPMMLALAIHWLRQPGRSLDKLLNLDLVDQEEHDCDSGPQRDFRRVVAHRLVTERIEDLYGSFKAIDQNQPEDRAALRKSLACATIAGGITRRAASDLFKLRADDGDLHRLFPEVVDTVNVIPPIGPWLLGEKFVRKVERDVFFGDTDAMTAFLRQALDLNPSGALKSLSRSGTLRHRIAALLETAPLPDNANMRLDLFVGLAQYALTNRGANMDKLLSLVESVDVTQRPEMMRRLELMTELDERSERLAAFKIFSALGSRRVLSDSTARQEVKKRFELLGRRLSDGLRPEETKETCQRMFSAMIQTLPRSPPSLEIQFEEAESTFFPSWTETGSQHLPWLTGILSAAKDAPLWPPLLHGFARLAAIKAAVYDRTSDRIASAEAALRELATIGPIDSLHITLIRGHASFLIDVLRAGKPAEAVADSAAEETAALLRRWPTSAVTRRAHARNLMFSALYWGTADVKGGVPGALTQCEAAAQGIDALVGESSGDQILQLCRATAWFSVAVSYAVAVHRKESTEDVARKIDEIAASFPDDAEFRGRRMLVWTEVARAFSSLEGRQDDAERAAALVDTIEQPGTHARRSALARCRAWHSVAHGWSGIRGAEAQCQAAANRVDAAARLFPDDLDIQVQRAMAWSLVAASRAFSETHLHLTAEAAFVVDDVAKAFPNDRLETWRAHAWDSVAYARSSLDAQRAMTQAAAATVDAIGATIPNDPLVQFDRVSAWRWVVRARFDEQDWKGALEAAKTMEAIASRCEIGSHSTSLMAVRAMAWRWLSGARLVTVSEEALRHVEDILAPFHANEKLQEARMLAWISAATRQAEAATTRSRLDKSIHLIDGIFERFQEHFRYNHHVQLGRARCWRALAFARFDDSGRRHLVESASEVVESIALHFPRDLDLQRECVQVWELASQAWARLGESEAAARALTRRDAALKRFPTAFESGGLS